MRAAAVVLTLIGAVLAYYWIADLSLLGVSADKLGRLSVIAGAAAAALFYFGKKHTQ